MGRSHLKVKKVLICIAFKIIENDKVIAGGIKKIKFKRNIKLLLCLPFEVRICEIS